MKRYCPRYLWGIWLLSTSVVLCVFGCADLNKELTPLSGSDGKNVDQAKERLKSEEEQRKQAEVKRKKAEALRQAMIEADPLRNRPALREEDRVLIVVGGEERYVGRDGALLRGGVGRAASTEPPRGAGAQAEH